MKEEHMQTIDELEIWLEDNCYNFNFITIGKHFAPEGYVFRSRDGEYIYSHSERGKETVIETFSTEKELVEYARELLQEEKWSRAHMVAFVFDENKIRQVEAELQEMKLAFERNDIPNYRKGERAYRIFVFGRDVLKCDGIRKRYME